MGGAGGKVPPMSLSDFRRLAGLTDVRVLRESTHRVTINNDGGGFKVIPPGADSQTYDSYLVGDNNGKTVQKFAKEALLQLAKEKKNLSSSEVQAFVNDYVAKHGGKHARPVRWNAKSYPD
jgi:hypothetical protein